MNQFIAALLNQQTAYTPAPAETSTGLGIPRTFALGSEWLYYKLYCGAQSSDKILTEVIKPLVDELMAGRLIDYWFFIRYYDSSHHLRLRFHLPDVNQLGTAISLVYRYLRPVKENGYLSKIQTCTYEREIERYGQLTMVLSEKLFFCDSTATLAFLANDAEAAQGHLRWIGGIRAIDRLLDLFGYGLPAKLQILGFLKEAFAKEFGMDQALKLQIDQKYREHRQAIQQAFQEASLETSSPDDDSLRQMEEVSKALAADILQLHEADHLTEKPDKLLCSYLHMHVNRLMPVNQRQYELLMYDFLYRHYRSQLAILQKS